MDSVRRALIVVDVQGEYVEGPLAIAYPSREASHATILQAIDEAESTGIPIVVVQHRNPARAPAFADGTSGYRLHPDIAARRQETWHEVNKTYASIFAGTGLADWLHGEGVDTVTLVGYMTSNCILASAAEAAAVGLTAEVLRDATGAINLANDAGAVTAQALHETLMVLLHSNFAATATTDHWAAALRERQPLSRSSLIASAQAGAAQAGH